MPYTTKYDPFRYTTVPINIIVWISSNLLNYYGVSYFFYGYVSYYVC